jgi:TolB protein
MKMFSLLMLLMLPVSVFAQWTNAYPPVEGFNHHIYLEAYELPILNSGPMDPAASPSGKELAFAAKGWIWVMDLQSGEARRITSSKGVDARPEWSPSGEDIVFVRDDGRQLSIVSVKPGSGKERVLVDVKAINLDPVFSPDENYVYYSSAESGQLYLWRVKLDTLEREQVSPKVPSLRRPVKRRPLVLDQDSMIVYLDKQGTKDSIEILNTLTNTTTTLVEDSLAAQSDMSLSPDGKYLAYVWPFDGGYELRLLTISAPEASVLLTQSLGMPLAPAFSHDGQWVYFAEANDEERIELKRISVKGGAVEPVQINSMDWGEKTGRLVIKSLIDGQAAPVRMNILDEMGHPVIPESGAVRSEGQNARIFFYSQGEIELIAPVGNITISAVQGFETVELIEEVTVRPNRSTQVTIELDRIWDASENGWYSADNHFHLNYGGTYRMSPEDILPDLVGEGLDIAYPLLANLHNRFLEQDLWGWSHESAPIVHFGQEVRSHFLGHLELIGTEELFWPWVWGPGYQLYGEDDRVNAEALRFGKAQGGLGGYVHPVPVKNPFTPETLSSIPIGFVADAVLGEVDLIELGCLWTDEIGTGALWHQVLNLGIPLAASAGSDVMNDYYRTMAIGATRVYVKPQGEFNTTTYLQALKQGRSFISNGPLLEFEADGKEPGQVIDQKTGTIEWALTVHSALPFASLEIFVNGKVVQTLEGNAKAGSKSYQGTVIVPTGGWITARVVGENIGWPAMDSYLFGESSPVWFGSVGSTDPLVVKSAAKQLLEALDQAESDMKKGYGNAPIPNLLSHFEEARVRLKSQAE